MGSYEDFTMNKKAIEYIQSVIKPQYLKHIDDSMITERVLRSNIEYKMLDCDSSMIRQVAQAQLSHEIYESEKLFSKKFNREKWLDELKNGTTVPMFFVIENNVTKIFKEYDYSTFMSNWKIVGDNGFMPYCEAI